MLRASRTYKTTALCAAFGLVAIAAATVPAAARSYTQCDADGDRCVRVHCDWDGDDCTRQSIYYHQRYYNGDRRWVCDEDGDNCHWTYYHNSSWYGPHVGLSLGWDD